MAPEARQLYPIEAIPTLGTGKVDLRAVKALAAAKTEGAGAATA